MTKLTLFVFGLLGVVVSSSPRITFDERSLILSDSRVLLLSGSVHYFRVPPTEWDHVFSMARDLNLNTIQTYFAWNQHEPTRGNWTWEGPNNLIAFIQAAHRHELFVTLRIGPYICGEFYFGVCARSLLILILTYLAARWVTCLAP